MKIQLLGTGASDGIPSVFGDSRVSRHARQHGGKDVRSRSAALIDDHLKIDLGPDHFHQMVKFGIDPTIWTAIVFTHTHDDHFCPSELQYMLFPFLEQFAAPLTIYGNDAICQGMAGKYEEWPFEIIQTKSFEPFWHLDYKITPIRAYHKLEEDSQNLLIEREGKTFLYATDTGPWQPITWEFLQDKKVDGVVIECTDGFVKSSYYGHMDLKECVAAVEKLRELGCIGQETPVATTHHGHLGDATHEELCLALEPHGIQTGYDGLVIQI